MVSDSCLKVNTLVPSNSKKNNNFAYKGGQLSIVAYNIAGLANKIYDRNFVNYIKLFDVFLLFETYVEDDFGKFNNIFCDYILHRIPAQRQVWAS